MRYQGVLTKWNDRQGFGFISQEKQKDIFVHICSFSDRHQRPAVGDVLSYEIVIDDKDNKQKIRAEKIKFISQRVDFSSIAKQVSKIRPVTLIITSVFYIFLCFSYSKGYLPAIVVATYFIMSLCSFAAYALDKAKAKANRYRISEKTLHFLDLMGGWLGGFLAQYAVNHKSTKQSFLFVFWLTIIFHIGLLSWLFLTSEGNAVRVGLFVVNDIVISALLTIIHNII